jgi:succinate-acetate transporter protein
MAAIVEHQPPRESSPGPAARQAESPAAIADPGPLGLGAFALTTFTLSIFNANILGVKLEAEVLPMTLMYGGLTGLLAGMWEFRKGNTFGALAFSSYGAFWLSFFYYVKYIAGGLPAASAHEATGLFLVAWTIFTFYMLLASLRTSIALIAVFVLLFAAFVFLALGNFDQVSWVLKAGGWLGLVTAAAAWYASAAGVINSTYKKNVVPLGHLG